MNKEYVRFSVFMQGGSVHDPDDPAFGPESFATYLTVLYQKADGEVGTLFRVGDETHGGDSRQCSSRLEADGVFFANFGECMREESLQLMGNFGEGAKSDEEVSDNAGRMVEELIERLRESMNEHPASTPTERVPDDGHYGLYL